MTPLAALGTAFTYQGRLTDGGSPAHGRYDFQFTLYDGASDGIQVGRTVIAEDATVTEGLFTVQLNFGSVFNGRALWLEIGVRPWAETGAYTTLSPRQELTGAPYAIYSLETAPHDHLGETWTGSGIGLTLRSSDDDGLKATGGSDPDDFGGWFGAYHGIYGEGTGASGHGGVFSSDNGDGVRVESAGDDGVNVGEAQGDGVHARGGSDADDYGGWFRAYHGVYGKGTGTIGYGGVFSSDSEDGVRVESAGDDGVYVESAADDGVQVLSAGGDGLRVSSANGHGVRVSSAGVAGVYVESADYTGVQVDSAGNDGVYAIGGADADDHGGWFQGYHGVYGRGIGATGYGGHFTSYNEDGVHVESAGEDGVHVESAGSPSTTEGSVLRNGFEVAGAQGHGLFVGRADSNGVYVGSTGGDGVYVISADSQGLRVDSAGSEGVLVHSADDDGVRVDSAGNPSTQIPSTKRNGFEVAGAQGHGLYVGQADDDGVYVESVGSPSAEIASPAENGFEVAGAEWHGVYVGRSDQDGVHVKSTGANGVYVESAAINGVYVGSAGGYAGYFDGDVYVSGTINKGAVGFKIDHPLDPENRYLYHSGVESPDMMNVYNGNVILDASGEAWVNLPDWFEALNRDFRYQLTPIGGPGPGLYIAEKVQNNRFKIAGGEPGLEVSWQVTGIRHDPYAEANRIPVEEEKPAEEQGTYLHPGAHGQPETKGLAHKEAQAWGPEEPEGQTDVPGSQ
jgi:hypothetical protein